MRPQNLKTKVFLDGGDPEETALVIATLGFLDGQTTNPTLISKNPIARQNIERGERFTPDEIMSFYRGVVEKISRLIPQGSVSVEVYADSQTATDDMLKLGGEMSAWIPNAHIKFPLSHQGLAAAEKALALRMRVNMTLCFSQEQAAAVYAASKGARKGDVFISPFVGRLDDGGENGMDLISNILRMYKEGDGHVQVLTASVRTLDHLLCSFAVGSDIVTAPAKVLKEWAERGFPVPSGMCAENVRGLKPISYRDISLARDWREYDIVHELTDKGMEMFSKDWNSLISRQ